MVTAKIRGDATVMFTSSPVHILNLLHKESNNAYNTGLIMYQTILEGKIK